MSTRYGWINEATDDQRSSVIGHHYRDIHMTGCYMPYIGILSYSAALTKETRSCNSLRHRNTSAKRKPANHMQHAITYTLSLCTTRRQHGTASSTKTCSTQHRQQISSP